jgi:hypothetical protein
VVSTRYNDFCSQINFFFFLAQLAAVQQELKVAQEAVSDPSGQKRRQIERPRGNIGCLQEAMGLAKNNMKYDNFCVSSSFFFLSIVTDSCIIACSGGDRPRF